MFSKFPTQFDASFRRIALCCILNTASVAHLFGIPLRDISKTRLVHSTGHRHFEFSTTALAQFLLTTEVPFLLPSFINYSTENLHRLASSLADDLSFTVSLSGPSSKSSLTSITCSGCRPYCPHPTFTSTTPSCIMQSLPVTANVVPSFGDDSELL